MWSLSDRLGSLISHGSVKVCCFPQKIKNLYFPNWHVATQVYVETKKRRPVPIELFFSTDILNVQNQHNYSVLKCWFFSYFLFSTWWYFCSRNILRSLIRVQTIDCTYFHHCFLFTAAYPTCQTRIFFGHIYKGKI